MVWSSWSNLPCQVPLGSKWHHRHTPTRSINKFINTCRLYWASALYQLHSYFIFETFLFQLDSSHLEHCSTSESILTIKFKLIKLLWSHFEQHFDPSNVCSYHLACPCANCHSSCRSYRLIVTILIYMLLFCVVSLVCVVSCHLIYTYIFVCILVKVQTFLFCSYG